MAKSIVPGKEVFQYAIRYLPTGRYLKRTSGSSFYETDIPACYNSPKVAKTSLETSFKFYKRFDPQNCEIVKFRLWMEEVKEPTPEEIEYEKELKNLQLFRKLTGEIEWSEIQSERGKWEMFRWLRHLDLVPIEEGDSLHCFDKKYKTSDGYFLLVWEHGQKEDDMPISISRGVEYNWDKRFQELKDKYGIR